MNPCKHMIDLLASYHRYLQALFYAKPTIERYLYEARDFVRYAGHHHKTGLISIQPKDLEAWEQSTVNSGRYQIKSIITRMRGLRAFFRFMVERLRTLNVPINERTRLGKRQIHWVIAAEDV